ncbi:hypothetical protein [Cohnella mopanensis]|uniref:hypothetical protein n=1 Tax=Cohnella mopanensis TaxID=2911966 RepID=UPI001EF93B43|nr:hypothetical protein [Cohnella mopanensis]
MATTNNGFPTISPSDTANVPRDFNALATAIDTVVGDMSAVPTTAKNAAGAIAELHAEVLAAKQSASNGKIAVAAAITGKGVPTAAGDTFAKMATNIGAIPVGPDTSDATAVAGDLRAGKTAYGPSGKVMGNVPVQAGGNVVPGASDIVKPAGIYDTAITVKGVPVDPSKVLAGTTIAGTAGTMPLGVTAPIGVRAQKNYVIYKPKRGYYDEQQEIFSYDGNFIAENIPEDIIMYGLQGALKRGKKFASGVVTTGSSSSNFTVDESGGTFSAYPFTVNSLAFEPKTIAIYYQLSSTQSSPACLISAEAPVSASGFKTGLYRQVSYYNVFRLSGNAWINASGFTLPVGHSNTSYFWYAIG